MREMSRFNIDGEELIPFSDVCEVLGIGRAAATEPILLEMIEPGNRRQIGAEWFVTDAGAFDLASAIQTKGRKKRHKPGTKPGCWHRPIFRRVYALYSMKIESGEYAEGDALPSTAAMKVQFGAADDKAIWRGRKLLENDGYVTITPGRRSQAIVINEYKQRSTAANGVVQTGRRMTLVELEAFNA